MSWIKIKFANVQRLLCVVDGALWQVLIWRDCMKAINITVRPCNQESLFTFMPLDGGVLVSCRSFHHEFGPCNPPGPFAVFQMLSLMVSRKRTLLMMFSRNKKLKTINLRIMTLWAHDISSAFPLYCLLPRIYFVEFMHGIFAYIYHKS